VDAVVHMLDHPDATDDDLMRFVKGPDFPTGGLILGRSGIIDAYKTGRGSIKLRAVAEIQEGRGGASNIVVTELPYQTSVEGIEAVLALIRGSADTDAARQGLMAEPFSFSEIQANHILDMPLRRLAQLEQQKLRDEMAELAKTIEELEGILSSDAKLRGVIKTELSEIADEFAEERRTQVTLETGDLDTLDLID